MRQQSALREGLVFLVSVNNSSKVEADCDVKNALEVPIRTIPSGVFYFVMIAFLAVTASAAGHIQPASAQSTATVATTGKKNTTKGVRTTAYQTRRSTTKVTKAKSRAQLAFTLISLPPEVSSDSSDSDIVARANAVVGSRYRWGGMSPATGFDCSGLVHYIYGAKAADLPRTAQGIYLAMDKVSDLRRGDIVIFGRGQARHAAVYIGNGLVVHASTPKTGVRRDSIAVLARALGLMAIGRVN